MSLGVRRTVPRAALSWFFPVVRSAFSELTARRDGGPPGLGLLVLRRHPLAIPSALALAGWLAFLRGFAPVPIPARAAYHFALPAAHPPASVNSLR